MLDLVTNRFMLTFVLIGCQLAPTQSHSLIEAMNKVKNPHQMCEKLYSLVQGLTAQLKEMINNKVTDSKS